MLNSLYGALGLPVFRFFDLDNAAAVTTCGQELIKFTRKITNYYYNKELGDKEDYVIYVDTDSVFASALPLVKYRNPTADVTDNKFMTKEILSIASEVQDFINESYNYFAKKFLNCNTHRFDIKQECVAKSAFWVTKKRYGQWIINDGGVTCDRLDVKGLDIVRSNFPLAFKTLMTEVLKDILSNVDKDIIDNKILNLKEEMKEMNLSDIALPTGVKNLKKFRDKTVTRFKADTMFTEVRKGTPVHVKSAILYNDLLKYYNIKDVQPIRSSDKIKWVYLKSNPFNIPTIAFKGYDDPDKILDFINQYVDHEKLFDRALNKKLTNWYDALDWTEPVDKEETLERFF
jgi:DNA polymerase elongation subunit (family B)